MHDLMIENMWAVYLCIVASPFVQEDAAVISATALAASGMAPAVTVLLLIWGALSVSDLWKYGMGRAAHRIAWARRQAERPAVARATSSLNDNLARSVLIARFIPGARIATYIAAGYAKAPFAAFAAYIVVGAALLIGVAYAAFRLVGEAFGERTMGYATGVLLGALLLFLAVRFVAGRNRAESTS